METVNCKCCGLPMEYEPIPGFPHMKPAFCDPCGLKLKADEGRAEREKAWLKLCPPAFADTDPKRLVIPASKLEKVMGWKPPRGLVIIGPSRTGKTRCMWLLVKRLVMEGVRVIATTATELASNIQSNTVAGAEFIDEYLRDLKRVPVLCIDDFGKFKVSENMEAYLFDILDYRTSHSLPTIITTNWVGDELVKKFSADRGVPIIERIREFCDSVKLATKPTNLN